MTLRHNAVRNVVFEAARQAAMAPRIEARVIPGSQERHADLLLPGTTGTVCDFAFIHPLQKKFASGTANKGPLDAVESYAFEAKAKPHQTRVEEEGFTYAPCVSDVYGNWGDVGRRVLLSVATCLSARDPRPAGAHFLSLRQRCSVVLTLWNMRAILSRWDPSLTVSDSVPTSALVGSEVLECAPSEVHQPNFGFSGDAYEEAPS